MPQIGQRRALNSEASPKPGPDRGVFGAAPAIAKGQGKIAVHIARACRNRSGANVILSAAKDLKSTFGSGDPSLRSG